MTSVHLRGNSSSSDHAENLHDPNQVNELADAHELARLLGVPATWIKERTRARATDRIPHLKLGRYCRFDLQSQELLAWIASHCKSSDGSKR